MNEKFKNFCEEIDASVFSGDTLFDPETRNEFDKYLDRWKRQVLLFAEMQKEVEEKKKKKFETGDVIELKAGHHVYPRVPEGYKNGLCKDGKWIELDQDVNYLIGKYIITDARWNSHESGHSPGDWYPDTYDIICMNISDNNIIVEFTQSGYSPVLNKNIEVIGKAIQPWEIVKE